MDSRPRFQVVSILIPWLCVTAYHVAVSGLLFINHVGIPDEGAYINLAENIVRGKGFVLDVGSYWHPAGSPYTHFAPGWPALLALGMILFGDSGLWIINGLVWATSSGLCFWLGQVCGLSKRWSWCFVAWLSLNPLYIFYHGHVMTETPTVAYNLALTAIMIRWARKDNWFNLICLAAVSAAAHITRSQAMLPIIAFWLTMLVFWHPIKWAKNAFIFGILHLALLSPWLYRMQLVAGTWTSTEIKLGINLLQFSGSDNPDPYGPDGGNYTLPEGVETMTPADRNRAFMNAAIEGIRRDPWLYLQKCGTRIRLLLSPVPNFYSVSPLRITIVFLSSILFFYLPACVALAGWMMNQKSRDITFWLPLVCLAIWYLFHILVNASIRNRLPSDPWWALMAISMATSWYSAMRASQRVTLPPT